MHDVRSSFEDHLASLRRYARSLVHDPIESDDLVQECMLRALSAPHLWPKIRNMRAYLFTVLHHAHADFRNDQFRRRSICHPDMTEHQLPVQGNQDSWLELRDMDRALMSLPKEQRDVVLLIGLDGFSYEEASRHLSVPIGTVMSRLFRARDALRHFTAGQIRSFRPEHRDAKQLAHA